MSETIDCFGRTDRGLVREANEDQFLIADLDKSMLVRQTSLPDPDHTRLFGAPRGHLLVVADGMGGVAGGKIASGLAVRTLSAYVLHAMPWFYRLRSTDGDQEEELRAAVDACQRAVNAAGTAEPGRARMGTTLTLAYVLWPQLYVIHAGDSRAYLMRNGQLHRLTRDHTVAQKMVDDGLMSPQLVESSRWSHVLTKCICAGREGIDPDVAHTGLLAGDTLLLCTDGLTKVVPDDRIADLLADGSAEAAAGRLVAAANDGGGPDNITVVVARFGSE